MKCLSTRRTPDGFKRRRYEDSNGVRFTTIEVPMPVWKGVASGPRVAARLVKWLHGREMAGRRARALALHAAGWKPEAIANEVGVTTRSVQRWVAQ